MDRVKKVFVNSGIRYDLILADQGHGLAYIKKICKDHVSGQMKVAPEHIVPHVLDLMGKQDAKKLLEFKRIFDRLSARAGKRQFLTYYFIAAHPGCTNQDMAKAKAFARNQLGIAPEQVQIFTPTPSTFSTLMYFTGCHPGTGEKIFVEKNPRQKEKQKRILVPTKSGPVKRFRPGHPKSESGRKNKSFAQKKPRPQKK